MRSDVGDGRVSGQFDPHLPARALGVFAVICVAGIRWLPLLIAAADSYVKVAILACDSRRIDSGILGILLKIYPASGGAPGSGHCRKNSSLPKEWLSAGFSGQKVRAEAPGDSLRPPFSQGALEF